MGKAVIFYILFGIFFSCSKQSNCITGQKAPINTLFIDWVKGYPIDSIGYIRFKSNNGKEESLMIVRDMNFSEWYLQNEDCSRKSEFRDYNLYSTIYRKYFQISILQNSISETWLEITNRSGLTMTSTLLSFEMNKQPRNISNNCDSCVEFYLNKTINNIVFSEVIQTKSPDRIGSNNAEFVTEMWVAKNYGLIRYVCADSSIWDLQIQ
jgi:hypothetical protein